MRGEAVLSSNVTARALTEEEFDSWTSFVQESPQGSPYSLPAYLDALCRAVGGRFRIVGAFKGTELFGGVGVYEADGRGGHYVSPRLLLYYNGIVLPPERSKYPSVVTSNVLKVQTALADWLSERNYARVTLKSLPSVQDVRVFKERGWRAYPTFSYVVPVDDTEACRSRIEQNLRRLIRRSEGRDVRFGVDDDFDAFYDLHAATMDRKNRATYLGRNAFESFYRALVSAGLAELHQARLSDGELAATSLVLLGPFRTAHIVSAAAREEYQRLGVNPFLRWKTFERLCGSDYSGVDLTDASLNPVSRFKSQLGGELVVSLEVDAPRSWRFRLIQQAAHVRRRARGAVGRLVRPLLPGRGG